MSSPLLLALWLAAPFIGSNSNCPSSRDIEDHLSILLPEQNARPGTALVVGLPDRLLVDLRPDSALAGAQRSVEVGDDCDERARAAAVLIATWWPAKDEGSPHPEIQAAIPKATHRKQLDLSIGAFASAILSSIAPGGRIELSLRGQKLGARLSLSGTASQGGALGRGKAEWDRWNAELGPVYAAGRLRLDVGFVASVLAIQGSSFQENKSPTGITVGATSGLRISWTWRQVLPWLELRGIWWPLSQRIYVLDEATGDQTSRALPHAEVQLAVGIAFSL
jgi:hypothetical protein